MHSLFEGIILGLTIAISIGPAFFALLDTSIKYGFLSGIYIALGIFISDLTLVFNSYLGASQIINNPRNHFILGLIGGVILIIFGIATFVRKVEKVHHIPQLGEVQIRKPWGIPFFLKGFFLNIANPMIWAFWITSMVAITSTYGADKRAIILFFGGTLLTVLATDMLKCRLANKINLDKKPHIRKWINRIVGIIFLAFGVFVILSVSIEYYRVLNH